jgi:hypothetical protein
MELINAKNFLPWGFAKIIAKQTGMSESMVYAVLNGKKKNKAILKAIIEMAENEKAETDQLSERVASL